MELDKYWKHETQINNILKRIKQIMPKFYLLNKILNEENKKLVYSSWIESIIRYGIEIYGNANKTQILRLQKAQNKVLKVLFNTNKSKLKTIKKRLQILEVLYLRKHVTMIKNFFPLKNISEREKNYSNLRTNACRLPIWRNNYGKMVSKYYTSQIFNELPKNFKQIDTYNELKKQLKAHYIKLQSE